MGEMWVQIIVIEQENVVCIFGFCRLANTEHGDLLTFRVNNTG